MRTTDPIDNPRPRARGRRRGLSVVEAMISLAISSLLLVGVASAYNASADAAEVNDRFFRATQAGRVSMNQMLTEIRRADRIVTATTNDSIIIDRPVDTRMNAEEQSREFKYDAAAKAITLTIYFKKSDGTTYAKGPYVMCRNVTEAKFGPPEKDKALTVELRVPVTVVVSIGGNSVRLSDTTGPRRLAEN